ncbi:MAG: DEAD/DEAH box helicase [Planctomycetota bacterium]|nr:DEAD/DEAH box helicase [Planctomycetota bacterium]MDA1211517.1 DEAD/DEAH box helicase [Planctomycetota bacterium]
MTLAEVLGTRFRGDIKFRGAAYWEAERVALTQVTPNLVCGIVKDGQDFHTQLSRESDQLRMFCNCSNNGQSDATCKHIWATVLAVDASQLMNGTPKPGHIPEFAVAGRSSSSFDQTFEYDVDDDDDSRDLYQPKGIPWTTAETTAAVVQRKEWEAKLDQIRSRLDLSWDDGQKSMAGEREIYYEIDIEESRAAGCLVVQTSQRQRRANGHWGKLKPLKLRAAGLAEIEDEQDRQILGYLYGGVPERTNWYAQQTELQAPAHRFRISYELGLQLVPLICETGRLCYLHDKHKSETESQEAERSEKVRREKSRGVKSASEKQTSSLQWDDGVPYEVNLQLIFDSDKGSWILQGQLRREESIIPLPNVVLVVPGGFVCTRTHLARLDDMGTFPWLEQMTSSGPIEVPAGDEESLVERLHDIPSLPRLDLPESLHLDEVIAEPAPQLVLRSPKGFRWRNEKLIGEVQFRYLDTVIRGSSRQWAIVQREEGRCLIRGRKAEKEFWDVLQRLGFHRIQNTPRMREGDVEIPARELGPAIRELLAEGWLVRADGQPVHQPTPVEFKVQSGIDWFELHANVNFEGQSIQLPELLSALARGDSTIRLADGSLGLIPEEWAKQYGFLGGLGTLEEEHLRFSATQAGLLDALLSSQPFVDYDEKFQELRDRLKQFDGVDSVAEPKAFKGLLRPYQREGLGWLKFLQDFHFGGCLADDMGLGKTVQLLALLEDRYTRRKKKIPTLVVVPKSLLFNWSMECHRFTPNLKIMEYAGIDRTSLRDQIPKHDIVLTTYGMMRRDILYLKDLVFDYIVLDEAQIIKNANSQVAKAARLLQAQHRLALSGTPIENHLGDLWSIFEFLNPGMLGRSSLFKMYVSESEDPESRRVLQQALRPFILRRTKKQVASDLPEKIEETIYCDLGKKQRLQYEELRDHYRAALLGMVRDQGISKSKIHVLEALLRLRQAACHPALLDDSKIDEPSAKLDVLCPYLAELIDEGHKVLVFSQFTSLLAVVRKHLDDRKLTYEYLDGQTRDRKARIEHFQNDPDVGIFLISLKAGGLGLNLTAADYVFLLDPWWNPAAESQAIDRAHRMGQTRQVFAYRLICRNTVEEKIAELQSKKKELAHAILEENSSLLQQLTTEDLELLLS